jgi:hypothetical protein
MGLSKSNTLHSEPLYSRQNGQGLLALAFHLQRFYYQKAFSTILSLGVVSFGICLANLLSVLFVSVQVVQLPPLVTGSMEKIEYDKATSSTPLPPAKPYHSTTTGLPGRGHSRVKGDGNVDIKPLSQPTTFPFSGRTAPEPLTQSPHDRTLMPLEQ